MIKSSLFAALLVCGTGFAQRAQAVDWYVATNGMGQGTGGWANATNSLQGAIDACEKSNTVWVSNGVYRTGAILNALDNNVNSNRIAIWKPVTVRSLSNDPAQTIILGGGDAGKTNAVRCVVMTNGAALIGFTLSGGRTRGPTASCHGAGIYSTSTGTVISNCIMADCTANINSGSGEYSYGGGAYQGTLYGCVLTNGYALYGGGAYGAVLYNCTIVKNSGGNGAGGMRLCTAYNSLIKGNTGGAIGGGGALDSTLYNCLVVNNAAEYGGGARFGYSSTKNYMYNCTVSGNTSGKAGGGIAPGPNYTNSVVVNSVIYSNTAPQGTNYAEGLAISYSCTLPATAGAGNRTDPPLFANSTGDYHLQPASPCINTGTNGSWTTGVDLDGNRRVFGDTADMGCYEYFRRGTMCVFW